MTDMYRTLDDWLVDHGSDSQASEVQGLFAGMLATSQSPRVEQEFAARLIEYADLQPAALQQVANELNTMVTTLQTSWSGLGLDFALLLPADDELIEERIDALGAWCGAFLSGVGLSGALTQSQSMSDDMRQALYDLSEIARITIDDDDGSLEHAFVEVCEHVRLSALVVATECLRVTHGIEESMDPPPPSDAVH